MTRPLSIAMSGQASLMTRGRSRRFGYVVHASSVRGVFAIVGAIARLRGFEQEAAGAAESFDSLFPPLALLPPVCSIQHRRQKIDGKNMRIVNATLCPLAKSSMGARRYGARCR
jgi:hypothetical protein